MKKIGMILLVLLLSLSCAAFAESEYTVGQQVSGFVVTQVGEMPLVGAQAIYLEHEKTGAQMLLLLNEDIERSFSLNFRTPTKTDMGVTHVFEHSTLSGSERFPARSLFFNLVNQTYNTYLNAGTYDVMTAYPMASLSEAQLLKYAEYYADSCFFPNVRDDERIFRTEAWRYALESADAPLTINGTVYSEMMKTYSLSEAAYQNLMDVLYPGCYAANCFGGVPERILDMTWQDVTDYHAAYYHPSNTLAILYGDVEEPEAFIRLLDGYYDQFEMREYAYENGCAEALSESTETVRKFATTKGISPKNSSVAYYGIILDDVAQEDMEQLNLLNVALSGNASPLFQMLVEAFPSASFNINLSTMQDQPVLSVGAYGINEKDAPLLRETVEAALNKLGEEGFSQEGLEADIAAYRMALALTFEEMNVGVNTSMNIAYMWAYTDEPQAYADFIASLDELEERSKDGTYQRLLETYLMGNQRSALVTTVPDPGRIEEQEKELEKRLAEIKAGMTEQQINQLVADTQALNETPSAEEAAPYVAQLQAVDVDSLPEEYRTYEVRHEEGENGVQYYDAVASVDGVGQVSFLLDASEFVGEDRQWLQLYIDLVGALPTQNHSLDEVYQLGTRYLYDGEIRLSVLDDDNVNGFTPYLRCTWKSTNEDLEASYDLIYELLFQTDFTDKRDIEDNLAYLGGMLYSTLNDESYMIQLYRAWSQGDAGYDYFTRVSYFDYMKFINKVGRTLRKKPQEVVSKLEEVAQKLCNSTNAVMMYSGNEEGIAAHRPVFDAFLSRLKCEPIGETAVYERQNIAEREGMIVDSSVKSNMLFATLEELGLEEFDAKLSVINTLVNDMYLIPLLRDQYGVYAVFHSTNMDGCYLVTYADPNVDKTFDVYARLPELLANTEIDQATLDGYVMSTYAYLTVAQGELACAQEAIFTEIDGKDQSLPIEWMRQVKAVTPQDVKDAAALYQAMLDKGMRSTAGSKSAIRAFSDLFDQTIALND